MKNLKQKCNFIYKEFSIYLMYKLNLHFWGDKLIDKNECYVTDTKSHPV